MIDIGNPAPDIRLLATGQQELALTDFAGHWLVVYFYPRDSTPGCTKEGQAFRDRHGEFTALDCTILGVSRDGVKAHENFKTKQEFPFDLLSDKEERLCQAFDVIKEKKLYGKVHMGIERSTFLIDPEGVVRHVWRKVKVDGHVDEVLATLTELASAEQ